ncbi:hypothetical protein GCM10009677_01790 [Sphaerisporangium rubeum]|uniref:Uncharacterized protein n=1 Tax=Sphaerisporangium rubeum TaxID=321317 RepID=A0A7X0ID96_9ACTN|nr:hypothetical protein [Sphaerisporangium rubeum]MBB6473130.1 hypothetical protein [Sphaerisporangium rubeum]
MADPRTRVDDFMRAPMAAAMFVLAGRQGFDADRLAEPATVTALTTTAQHDLNPWYRDAAAERTRALTLVRPLHDLVTKVVTDPRNAWWSAPLDRHTQLLLTGRDDRRRDDLRVPTGPNDGWETYAQRPAHAVITSTELPVATGDPIRSGAHAELSHGVGDWDPVYPMRQERLTVSPTARVYEVNSPEDWHHLVLRHTDTTTPTFSDENLRDTAGLEHGPAPTWSTAATEHDAVHLTFTGLLTTLYVPHTTANVTTTLWSWSYESTLWLRQAFDAATTLDDLLEPPGAHADGPRL